MKASAKTVRITPKKLNLVAELARSKDALAALEILEFTPKKGAKILHKVVKSAIANAENNFKQSAENLFVKEIVVTKASTYKRWLPASRGRAQPIIKRNAHVTVTIGVKEEAPKKETTEKKTKSAVPKAKTAAPKKESSEPTPTNK